MHRFSLFRKSVLTCLVVTVLGLPGCSVGVQSHTETTGTYIGQQTLAQITPGKTKEYVLAVLGNPGVKKPAGDNTEIWEWSYTEKKITSGDLPFVVGSASSTDYTHTIYVEFDNGVVGKKWSD